MMPCSNTVAEINYDRAQIALKTLARYSREEKRIEVIDLANKLIAGKPVRITYWGDQQYTLDDLMQSCYDDTERYGKAFLAMLKNDGLPMKKLAVFHAKRVASHYLFEGEDLGFDEWRD